jgi:DNA-binding NarL/FixJ family response regulator
VGWRCSNSSKPVAASVGVLVCGADSTEAALAAYRAGADGYFPQSREPQELVMAIADVAAGQRYFPNWMCYPPRLSESST